MKMNTFEKITSKIKAINEKKVSDINRCNSLIAEEESAIQEAEKLINVNTEIDGFLQASERKAKAEETIKACKKRIELLNTQSLMSEEEYTADKNAIRSEQKKISEEAFNKMVNLMNQMFKLYDEAFKQIESYNNLLRGVSEIAHHDTTSVAYQDEMYSVMKGYIGKLEYQMKNHPKYSDRFKN